MITSKEAIERCIEFRQHQIDELRYTGDENDWAVERLPLSVALMLKNLDVTGIVEYPKVINMRAYDDNLSRVTLIVMGVAQAIADLGYEVVYKRYVMKERMRSPMEYVFKITISIKEN